MRSLEDFTYLARLVNGVDLSDTINAQLGGSALFGPNGTGNSGRTQIVGADLIVKWVPLDANRGWPFVKFQAEVLHRQLPRGLVLLHGRRSVHRVRAEQVSARLRLLRAGALRLLARLGRGCPLRVRHRLRLERRVRSGHAHAGDAVAPSRSAALEPAPDLAAAGLLPVALRAAAAPVQLRRHHVLARPQRALGVVRRRVPLRRPPGAQHLRSVMRPSLRLCLRSRNHESARARRRGQAAARRRDHARSRRPGPRGRRRRGRRDEPDQGSAGHPLRRGAAELRLRAAPRRRAGADGHGPRGRLAAGGAAQRAQRRRCTRAPATSTRRSRSSRSRCRPRASTARWATCTRAAIRTT